MHACTSISAAYPSPGWPHRLPMRDTGPAAASAPCASIMDDAGSRGVMPGEGRLHSIAVIAERASDERAREALLDAAMGPGRRRKSSEKLRRGRLPADGLALVALDEDGRLLGTVRLWNVRAGDRPALLLGPLAVDPSVKSAGVGSALMRHAIAEAARLGHGAILLVGDAGYYRRFGFDAALTRDLAMPGPYEIDRFLALELRPGALAGSRGVIRAAGRKVPVEKRADAA